MSYNLSFFENCNATEKFIENSTIFQKLDLALADFSWPMYFFLFFLHLLQKYKDDLEPAHVFALNPMVDSICIGIVFTINEQLNIWTKYNEEVQQKVKQRYRV